MIRSLFITPSLISSSLNNFKSHLLPSCQSALNSNFNCKRPFSNTCKKEFLTPLPSSLRAIRLSSSNIQLNETSQEPQTQELSPTTVIEDSGAESSSDSSFSVDILPDRLYKSIQLELLAYEPSVLNSYSWFIQTAASHLSIPVQKVWEPQKSDKERFPLLKSVHVHKKHRAFYEIRTYHKFIVVEKLTGSTASTFLEYVQRNIPEGVGMKVTKVQVLPKPSFLTLNTK